MAWRAGENVDPITCCFSFSCNFLPFLSVDLCALKDGGLQRAQPGAAEEGLPTGKMQHVRRFNFSNIHALSQICRRCFNDIPPTRAAANIWTCRESLILSFLSASQVTDGAAAQAAGSGHEYI